MSKILNLDQFAPEERSVDFKGKRYAIRPATVEDFIRNTKRAQELARTKMDLPTQIEETAKMIAEMVPGLPVEEIKKLSLEQLAAFAAFVRGEEVVVPGEANKGEKKAKAK